MAFRTGPIAGYSQPPTSRLKYRHSRCRSSSLTKQQEARGGRLAASIVQEAQAREQEEADPVAEETRGHRRRQDPYSFPILTCMLSLALLRPLPCSAESFLDSPESFLGSPQSFLAFAASRLVLVVPLVPSFLGVVSCLAGVVSWLAGFLSRRSRFLGRSPRRLFGYPLIS